MHIAYIRYIFCVRQQMLTYIASTVYAKHKQWASEKKLLFRANSSRGIMVSRSVSLYIGFKVKSQLNISNSYITLLF